MEKKALYRVEYIIIIIIRIGGVVDVVCLFSGRHCSSISKFKHFPPARQVELFLLKQLG